MTTNNTPTPPNNDTNSSTLQLIPEAVLKKKHDLDELKAHWAAQQISNPRGNRKVFSSQKPLRVTKPETVLAKARSQRNQSRRYLRVRKKGMMARASTKKVEVTERVEDKEGDEGEGREVSYATNSVGANLVFVVRIRDAVGMPKNVRRALTTLRLKSVNEGVFVRYTPSNRKKLHLLEPYITYGPTSKSTITDLIRRRGHGHIDGKRIPLSDNTVIENALGEKTNGALICVDDLVHEVYTVGEEFARVTKFLWTFRLTAPRSRFQKDKLGFKDGGDYGDRGDKMDELIRQML